MSVPPVTVNGVRPYSDTPVIVGPSQVDFASVLGTAVASSSTSATSSGTSAGSTASRSAAIGSSLAASRSGLSVSSAGALVTSTGRNVMTLGQMVGAGGVSSSSPLGTASISRPGGALAATISPVSSTTSKSGAQAPAALLQYGNGKIPTELLTPIGISSHRLYAPAAEGFIAMRAAAAAEGIDIGVTDSYRTYEQQVDLAARKGLYKNGGLAAVPGTSKHGWGMAIDIDVDTAGLAWMRENASRFGFVENVPREPWHWEFVGANG